MVDNTAINYFRTIPKYDTRTEQDHIAKLASYILAKEADFALQFKKMMIRMVGCALGETYNNYIFILKGEQDIGKTQFVRHLTKPFYELYSNDIDHGLRSLSEAFVIEADNIVEEDLLKIKELLAVREYRSRKYGERKIKDRIRQTSFFGTTNNKGFEIPEEYPKGFLLFNITEIRHDNGSINGYNRIDINRVYAQAKYLHDNGFNTDPTSARLREPSNIIELS